MTWQRAQPLEWMRALPPPSKDLPRAQRDVLIELALAMQRDGAGWVSLAGLARRADVSVRTAGRAVTWARDAGLLERTTRGQHGRASTYRLVLPNLTPNGTLAGPPTRQSGAPNLTSNVTPSGLTQARARARATVTAAAANTAASKPRGQWPAEADPDGQACDLCQRVGKHASGCRASAVATTPPLPASVPGHAR
jgi:hypothetical protein